MITRTKVIKSTGELKSYQYNKKQVSIYFTDKEYKVLKKLAKESKGTGVRTVSGLVKGAVMITLEPFLK